MRPGPASAGITRWASSTKPGAPGTRATSSTAWAISRILGTPSGLLSPPTARAPTPVRPDLAQQLAAFQAALPGSRGATYLQLRGILLTLTQQTDHREGSRRDASRVWSAWICHGRLTSGMCLKYVRLSEPKALHGITSGLRWSPTTQPAISPLLHRSLNLTQFVARKYWLWSCASARCFRPDCMKIGGIIEAYAYPYHPTAVNYKI